MAQAELLQPFVIGGLEEEVPIPQLEGVMKRNRLAVEPKEITGQLAALGGDLCQLRIEPSSPSALSDRGSRIPLPSLTLEPEPLLESSFERGPPADPLEGHLPAPVEVPAAAL